MRPARPRPPVWCSATSTLASGQEVGSARRASARSVLVDAGDVDHLDPGQRTGGSEQEVAELGDAKGDVGTTNMMARLVGTRHPDAGNTVIRLHVHGGLRQLASVE